MFRGRLHGSGFPMGLQWEHSTSLLYIVIATTITKQQTSVEYLKCARSFNPPNSFFWWLLIVSLFYIWRKRGLKRSSYSLEGVKVRDGVQTQID